MTVRLVAHAVGDRYIAETDEEYLGSGEKVCRIYFPDGDYLVPGWRLPIGSFVKFADPWDVEEVSRRMGSASGSRLASPP